MKTKLDFIILCMFFFAVVLGYSSDTPPSPGPPNNNLPSSCGPCNAEEAISFGAGNHGPLSAVTEGWARKDGTEFKWRAKAMVKNTDTHIKGEYTLFYGVPHTQVIVKINREDLVDVDADPSYFAFTDHYEGEMGAVVAVESTRPFSIQNAITEVNKISATSLIHGKPLSENDPNSENTHQASADLPYCVCEDGNGEGGADNGGANNNLGTSPTVTSTNTGYSSSYGCDYNAEYDYCTDTGWCSAGSGEFEIGMCGHRWCCCAP